MKKVVAKVVARARAAELKQGFRVMVLDRKSVV
jgi:hypothetical protein